jgi:hypothetical protein
MKSRTSGGIVRSTIVNAKAESIFRSSTSVAAPIVRLAKGTHHVTHTDDDVGTGRYFSGVVGDRLGTVRGGRA